MARGRSSGKKGAGSRGREDSQMTGKANPARRKRENNPQKLTTFTRFARVPALDTFDGMEKCEKTYIPPGVSDS